MFTGIIEELGKVKVINKKGGIVRLEITAQKVCEDTKIGDSISVNGVCLTAVALKNNVISFDVMTETVQVSTLKSVKIGEVVNLERALKVGDRVGGHFVTGHIDFVGVIRSKKIIRGDLELQIGVPSKFLKYIIRKGSVAVDGISLTISDVKSGSFSVCIIPHTAKITTLGFRQTSDKVNVELDMLVK